MRRKIEKKNRNNWKWDANRLITVVWLKEGVVAVCSKWWNATYKFYESDSFFSIQSIECSHSRPTPNAMTKKLDSLSRSISSEKILLDLEKF